MAVASAGLYASLHLIPDNHASIPPLSLFTGRMPFLPPNQQCQSTEGTILLLITELKLITTGNSEISIAQSFQSSIML